MSEYLKPLPDLDNEFTKPFWTFLKNHEYRMQRCVNCGHIRFPVTPVCTDCLCPEFEWHQLSGRGTVWSWVQFHHLYHQGWAEEMPYNVAYVLLDEGIGVITNLVNVDFDDIRFNMPVKIYFDDVTEDVTLPKFEPA